MLPASNLLPLTTPIFEFKNWTDLFEFYNANYEKLLAGDELVEPEGYVVHLYGDDGEWVPIKLKYDFFYAAHKPGIKKYTPMSKELLENPFYGKLKKRLVKFRVKPTLKYLLQDIIEKWLDENDLVGLSKLMKTKKEWYLYWTSRKEDVQKFQQNLVEIVKGDYSTFNPNIMAIILSFYGNKHPAFDFIDKIYNSV